MSATMLVYGEMLDGASKEPTRSSEIPIKGNRIASVARSVAGKLSAPLFVDIAFA